MAVAVIAAVVVGGMALTPNNDQTQTERYLLTGLGQFAVALLGFSIGIKRASLFGFKSALGRSVTFISAGMLSWGLGALAWMYYNFAGSDVPYPSLADVGYLGTIPLVAIGLFVMFRSVVGHKNGLFTALKMAIITAAVFIVTYWLFISSRLSENVEPLAKVLNVTYPMGDVVFLSFALLILSCIMGGKLFKPIAIISAGIIIEALADFSFSWTTSIQSYYTGSYPDMLFVLAFAVIAAGIYFTKDLATVMPPVKAAVRKK